LKYHQNERLFKASLSLNPSRVAIPNTQNQHTRTSANPSTCILTKSALPKIPEAPTHKFLHLAQSVNQSSLKLTPTSAKI